MPPASLPNPVNPDQLRRVLAPEEPVAAIGFPPEASDALDIPAEWRLKRGEWKSWLPQFQTARTVLLWINPRREDDQAMFRAIGLCLSEGTRLFTFHAMSVLTSDRLTGDAVQQLLDDAGLLDSGCVNSGFGYYARRFVRKPGTTAILPEDLDKPPPAPPEPEPVEPVEPESVADEVVKPLELPDEDLPLPAFMEPEVEEPPPPPPKPTSQPLQEPKPAVHPQEAAAPVPAPIAIETPTTVAVEPAPLAVAKRPKPAAPAKTKPTPKARPAKAKAASKPASKPKVTSKQPAKTSKPPAKPKPSAKPKPAARPKAQTQAKPAAKGKSKRGR